MEAYKVMDTLFLNKIVESQLANHIRRIATMETLFTEEVVDVNVIQPLILRKCKRNDRRNSKVR